MTKSTLFFWA